MKAILALLAAAGIGGWMLFGKKKTAAASTTSVVIPASTIATPVGNVAVTAPTATKPGSVTVTPAADVPGIMPANVVAALESDSPDDLYRTGMASNDKVYVTAAATRLAELSDTRAMDLTVRVANWGS